MLILNGVVHPMDGPVIPRGFVAFEGEKQVFHYIGEGVFHYEPLLKWVKEEKPQIDLLLENCRPERYKKDTEYLQKLYNQL